MTNHDRPGADTVAGVATRAAVLRRLELAVLRRLDGVAAGDNPTTGIGPGSEREGAREYGPGDDARLIDWNLTARLNAAHVRTTEADREVDTWIVIDRSASMDFGTANAEKRDVALGAAAAFGLLTLRGHNRLGVMVAGVDRLQLIPPRSGHSRFMAALGAIYDTTRQGSPPSESSDLTAALHRMLAAQRRRSQMVVISDFLDSTSWAKPIRVLGVRHQVIAVHITDPRELALPAVGILAVVDAETGRQRYVQTQSASLRARYAAAARERHATIQRVLVHSGAEYLHLSTSRDWVTDSLAFATRRKLLSRNGGVARLRAQTPAGLNVSSEISQ